MPRPGMMWRHVVISTRSSWLHGDRRGFRSRNHRIHSSGDYHRPPPDAEHAGLRRYMQERSGPPIVIPGSLRREIGRSIIESLRRQDSRVLALSVSGMHAHILAELPQDARRASQVVGSAKQAASYAVRDRLPGAVWARGGSFKPINDRKHQERTYDYIQSHEREGAWVWSALATARQC